MLQTYTINDSNPLSLAPSGRQGTLNLLNTGAHPVFVSDTAAGNLSAAYQINPNGNLQWSAQIPLYAFTRSGEETRVLVNDAAVQLANTSVSATIDGPVEANINGTVPVTGNVGVSGNVGIDGTVPVTGAVDANVTGAVDANVSGSVDVIGGNIDVTGEVTSTVRNTLNFLGGFNPTFTSNGWYGLPLGDISAYTSLIFIVRLINGPNQTGLNAYPSVVLRVGQYDADQPGYLSSEDFAVWDTETVQGRLIVDVTGEGCTAYIRRMPGQTLQATDALVVVWGSSVHIEPRYIDDCTLGSNATLPFIDYESVTIPAATAVDQVQHAPVSSKSGRMSMFMMRLGDTSASVNRGWVQPRFQPLLHTPWYGTFSLVGTGFDQYGEFLAGRYPIMLCYASSAANHVTVPAKVVALSN